MTDPRPLLCSDLVMTATAAKEALRACSANSQYTYLLWDMSPRTGWIGADHQLVARLVHDRYRPLYLGKSAGRARVTRHLSKDGLGSGLERPNSHVWKNPALFSYCLMKSIPGWLGLTFLDHGDGEAADLASEALEQASVQALGRRTDLDEMRRRVDRTSADSLVRAYGEIHLGAVPRGSGLLFNQEDPKPDGRKARFR